MVEIYPSVFANETNWGKKHSVSFCIHTYVVGKLAGRAVAWIGDKISV